MSGYRAITNTAATSTSGCRATGSAIGKAMSTGSRAGSSALTGTGTWWEITGNAAAPMATATVTGLPTATTPTAPATSGAMLACTDRMATWTVMASRTRTTATATATASAIAGTAILTTVAAANG